MKSILLISLASTLLIAQSDIQKAGEPAPQINKPLYKLGETLFAAKSLSFSKQVSCKTCHDIKTHGSNNHKFAPLQKSRKTSDEVIQYNTTSVFQIPNAPKVAHDWIGVSQSLSQKIKFDLLDYTKMSAIESELIESIKESDKLKSLFLASNTEIKTANIVAALQYYISNITLNKSKLEKHNESPKEFQLSTLEKEGKALFEYYGCNTCHNGKNFGANSFQKYPIFNKPPTSSKTHLGVYDLTKNPEDKNLFRVPGLINVNQTAPYLHDGSINNLSEVIKAMGKNQLGIEIPDNKANAIKAFLETLNKTPLEK